jgi:hypothetical protein
MRETLSSVGRKNAREATMLGNLLGKLFGKGGSDAPATAEPVEYKGCRIFAEPFADGGQYQTAGRIEKDFEDGVREHRFIRAEKHPSREEAESFSLTKARQIIDGNGDSIFRG